MGVLMCAACGWLLGCAVPEDPLVVARGATCLACFVLVKQRPAAAGVKFIRFAEIIGGQGPVDILSHVGPGGDELQLAQWAHMCDPFPFTAMREVAYRNHGLQVRPPAYAVHEPRGVNRQML